MTGSPTIVSYTPTAWLEAGTGDPGSVHPGDIFSLDSQDGVTEVNEKRAGGFSLRTYEQRVRLVKARSPQRVDARGEAQWHVAAVRASVGVGVGSNLRVTVDLVSGGGGRPAFTS